MIKKCSISPLDSRLISVTALYQFSITAIAYSLLRILQYKLYFSIHICDYQFSCKMIALLAEALIGFMTFSINRQDGSNKKVKKRNNI